MALITSDRGKNAIPEHQMALSTRAHEPRLFNAESVRLVHMWWIARAGSICESYTQPSSLQIPPELPRDGQTQTACRCL